MNLLLDTHVALWAFSEPSKINQSVRSAIIDPANSVAVSSVSVWEVEIKRSLGKLTAPPNFAALCTDRGFDELQVSFAHAERAGQLPRHHDDPFDRMLIAQAIEDDLQIVTADRSFAAYEARVLAAR